MTILLSLVTGFFLGIVAIVFAIQNNETTALTFLNWQFESSLALVVISSVVVGALMSALLSLPGAIEHALRTHALRRENRALKNQVESTPTASSAPLDLRP